MQLTTNITSDSIVRTVTIKCHGFKEKYIRIGKNNEFKPQECIPINDQIFANNPVFGFSEKRLLKIFEMLDIDLDRAFVASNQMQEVSSDETNTPGKS